MSSDKPEKVSTNPVSAGYSLLVRSLSKGNPTTMFSNTNASPPSQPEAPASPSVSPKASRTASSSSAETTTSGLTAIEKFKNISARATMQKETKPQWPPTSWMVSASHENIGKDKTSPELAPPATDALRTDGGDAPEKEGEGDAAESASIARKIQDIFSSISTSLPALPTSIYSAPVQAPSPEITPQKPPSVSTPTPAPVAPVPATDAAPEQDPTPTPPPPAPGVIDSKLAALLSSASVMNGSISKGRQSVWAALERLRAPKSSQSPSSPDTKDPENAKGTADEEIEVEDDMDDDSSVMMYAPLVPDAGSEVEIARSEVSYVDRNGGLMGVAEGDWNARREVLAKERLDTLRRRKHEGKEKEKEEVQAEEQVMKGKGKGKEPKPKKVREVRVWVPSPTQLSFQATWWGYRLYLPPPVLDILGNKQLEAAKRAAMLTAALRWLLEHIPIKLFPPQFRPVLMIVKRLGPYLGYIGSGIAWSWAGIKAFDNGNGVILTATWLMPVALIPGTWEEGMFDPPGPTTPPKDPAGSESVSTPPSKTQTKDSRSSKTTEKSR